MKIIHVEGGLGNQMACYAVYIATKMSNPQEEIYIDTYLYDVKEAHKTISMWNGYELEKVFGINIPDIRSLFDAEQIDSQIDFLRKSEFWKHDWNYAEAFIKMMKNYGIYLENAYGKSSEEKKGIKSKIKYELKKVMAVAPKNKIAYRVKHLVYRVYNLISNDSGEYLYKKREGDFFYDITLDFMKSKMLNETIGYEVRKGLKFKEPTDLESLRFLDLARKTNSVSVHVRRTDYLQFNEDCYKYGYFKKCIGYIKRKVERPNFFIFSDDLNWCKENLCTIGLTEKDTVYYVDVNRGSDSYKDMYIIANCKHNIATKSSFGWWGSFLNENPDKITCCQVGSYVSTNQF